MRILQLIFNLGSGGAEKFTVDLCNELSKKNDVILCVIQKESKDLSFFRQQVNENVKYKNLGCRKGINMLTFFTIFRLIQKVKPEVVHAHLNTKIYLFLPSIFFKSKIKFVHTIHSLAEKDVGFQFQKQLNNYFYSRRFINAVSISKECNTSFINFYKNIEVNLIENGASPLLKTKDFQKVKYELESLKNNTTDLVFIHVGRFSKEKNQKLLVNVFNRFFKNNINSILLIIGPNYDIPEAKILRGNSNQKIHYLGAKQNVADYLLNSDVFVLTSQWEGLPISLLEAMSCGVIPVCTPAGGIPDVIKNDTIGFLSKDFLEEEFYLALIKCVEKIDVFDRDNLINFFKINYSMEKCTERYIQIYQGKE